MGLLTCNPGLCSQDSVPVGSHIINSIQGHQDLVTL